MELGMWHEIEKYVRAIDQHHGEFDEGQRFTGTQKWAQDEGDGYMTGIENVANTADIGQSYVTAPPREGLHAKDQHAASISAESTRSPANRQRSNTARVANEDVELIKEMYVLGKRVGKDLVHPSGSLIARRGDRISRDIMQEAEGTGKLVELIVNMTFDREVESYHK